jgi:hypothetical protein
MLSDQDLGGVWEIYKVVPGASTKCCDTMCNHGRQEGGEWYPEEGMDPVGSFQGWIGGTDIYVDNENFDLVLIIMHRRHRRH